MTVSSRAISANKSTSSINLSPTHKRRQLTSKSQQQQHRTANCSSPEPSQPASPIRSSLIAPSNASTPNVLSSTIASSDNDSSWDQSSIQVGGCHRAALSSSSSSHLLGALGPKMQTLLHKTIGGSSSNQKTHRRQQSEMDISWLPTSSNNNNYGNVNSSEPQKLKQSQSLLYLRSPRQEHQRQHKPAKGVRMKLFHQRIDKLFNQKQLKLWNETVRLTSNPFCDSPDNRRQLELETIPEPIRNLLKQINSRGPETEGIFRKSPSAKHCKELRQKLESDSRSSIEEFQVTVIASVFKEWLRSLPDCLLMSRLYPQWIDVAKLIEPLQQQQQQKQQQQQQQPAHLPSSNQQASVTHSQLGRHLRQQLSSAQQPEQNPTATAEQAVADDDRDNGDDSRFDKDQFANPSLRPSRSSLADAGCHQPLDRARSCSTMLTDRHHQVTADTGHVQQVATGSSFAHSNQSVAGHGGTSQRTWRSLASFKQSERRSECLRFVRQLLDNLNDSNLVLLRSFMSVLCGIASNSEVNKMSASNLGVCVGQSLLNDEQQQFSSKSSAKLSGYNFSRRLRRTRSYSILSSTFSQSNPNLKIDTAQETAKYVPILVTFMIENARQLFGADIVELFPSANERESDTAINVNDDIRKSGVGQPNDSSMITTDESTSGEHSPFSFLDQVDCCQVNSSSSSSPLSLNGISSHQRAPETAAMRQMLVVNNQPVVPSPADASEKGQYSSSANSSSTSGVHSESPAFSSELDSHNNSRISGSPRSSVSSPSSISSSSSHHQHQHSDVETSCTRRTTTKQEDLSQTNVHRKQVLSFNPSSPLYHYHTLASSTPKSRHRNSLPPNCFSPFMGSSLNRAPKLPVRLGTSSYGGEAIIYNPKPDRIRVVCPHDDCRHKSAEPLSSSSGHQLDESKVITVAHNESHKEERLNQFLAHQHEQQRQRPLPSAAAIVSARQDLHQHQRRSQSQSQSQSQPLSQVDASNVATQREQPAAESISASLQVRNSIQAAPIGSVYHQQHNKLNYPIFSSNLNSLQSHQQHQYYSSLVCCSHGDNFFEPARSHVMSLRDYYLSLQQRQQQQQNSYTLHRHSQLMRHQHQHQTSASNETQTSNNLHHHQTLLSSSQYYDHKKQHQLRVLAQGANSSATGNGNGATRQPQYRLVESSNFQMAPDSMVAAISDSNSGHQHRATAGAVAIRRPQRETKPARIRQNQFNNGRLYAPTDSSLISIGQTVKLSSSDHSSGDSSDSSDDFSNDWTESTMV